jgi:hypothetical protein
MNTPASPSKHSLSATVRSLDAMSAILVLVDGQVLRWPLRLMPPDVKAGDQVQVIIHDLKLENAEQAAVARAVINEIFSND